jgi:uncharacterized integral membrane protein (TIGR00698 family)
VLTAALAACGVGLARIPAVERAGLSALTLAILCGIVVGNTVFARVATKTAAGVDLSKGLLLRVGIILYGFRITFQQMAGVGWTGVLVDALMIGATFMLAVLLGTRVFRLDRQTSMLIGAGSAICGAAAVMATEPVVRAQAHKVSIAVATVVIFGTIAMFLYPVLFPYLGMTERQFGVYAGSTIHEVAQVIAAGNSVSDAVAGTAVIEKMLRVMMLAPFLLTLSAVQRTTDGPHHGPRATGIMIPWFALLFIGVSAFNSLHWLSAAWNERIVQIDTVLLAMAMSALGLRTHLGAIRQAGAKPLLLAGSLFMFLLVGGYALNRVIMLLR